MRLKALLVDDEVNILKNLQAVIPGMQLDIEVVGAARNGQQALEIARQRASVDHSVRYSHAGDGRDRFSGGASRASTRRRKSS